MNLKTKKIIAREGLIILCLIFMYLGVYVSTSILYDKADFKVKVGEEIIRRKQEGSLKEGRLKKISLEELNQKKAKWQVKRERYSAIQFIGILFVILLYPFYWLIRFIIWSIRTLRQKE